MPFSPTSFILFKLREEKLQIRVFVNQSNTKQSFVYSMALIECDARDKAK